MRGYCLALVVLTLAGVAASAASLPIADEIQRWEEAQRLGRNDDALADDKKLVAWERQLSNRTLPGWPIEHEHLLLAQLTTQNLLAFRKEDGSLAWWLPLECVILPGGSVSKKHRILAFTCVDAVFAVPMDIHGKFHHKKKHLMNEVLWSQPPPKNNSFVAPPLIRENDVLVVGNEGHIIAHDLLTGANHFKSKVRVCPVEPRTPLPLYVASVFQKPLVACVLFDDNSKSVSVLNGDTGDVEERFPGPVVPLPTAKPTPSPHRSALYDLRRVPDANKVAKGKDVAWTPLVDRWRPLLGLHIAVDDEDGEDEKLHHSNFVWALVSEDLHPPRVVVSSLELRDVLVPPPPPETPRPHRHEDTPLVVISALGGDDPLSRRKHKHKQDKKKVVSTAEYHILKDSVGIDSIAQGSHSIVDAEFAKTFFFVTTHCGATTTGCLTANVYDATDLKAGPKVQITLPTEVVLNPGGRQPLGPPQQLTSDTSRLLVLQKVETSNSSLPQALLSGFRFDVVANTSEATFSQPQKWDPADAMMNINGDTAAVPTPIGVEFLNATTGVPEKRLPLLPTHELPSDIVSDNICFYFAAGEFLFGIPRLLV